MDCMSWQSTLEKSGCDPSWGDECGTVASYLTVSADVNFSSGSDVELRVLDPVKLEPTPDAPYGESGERSCYQSLRDTSEGSCYPALSIACDILDVDPGEFGLNNSEIDSLLSDGNAYRSDTDSGITSDCDSSLDEIDLILQEMKRSKENDPHQGGRGQRDAPYPTVPTEDIKTQLTPMHKVISGFTLWRVDDSHMPIKKRRRTSEHGLNHSKTFDVISGSTNHSRGRNSGDVTNYVHTSLFPRHCVYSSSSQPDSSPTYQPLLDPPRKKPGRKPGQCSKGYHLWEFMRDLLLSSDTCPRDVMWVDEDNGIFRICNSDRVAKLWGARKNNKKLMTYEKLSRALRFSRTAGYFGDLPKNAGYPRKLCFKFGPKTPLGRNKIGLKIKLENFVS